MVRAVDLAMTVGAAPVEEENRCPSPRSGGVKDCLMTLSTDPGVSNFEESVVDRTVRLVAIGTIFKDRRMLPEKRAAPLCMAHVTGFIDACLFKLRRIRSSVRVVAIGTGQLPFRERHVGGAHELGPSLQVTLTANLCLGPLVRKNSLVADLGELEAVGSLFHNGMAIDAGDSAAGMRARLPVGLDSSLMALETGFVLDLGGDWRILTECDQSAHALSSAGRHVVAPRTMAGLACLSLKIIAGIE